MMCKRQTPHVSYDFFWTFTTYISFHPIRFFEAKPDVNQRFSDKTTLDDKLQHICLPSNIQTTNIHWQSANIELKVHIKTKLRQVLQE